LAALYQPLLNNPKQRPTGYVVGNKLNNNVMNHQEAIRHRWLLIGRGVGYILLGFGLFVYSLTFTPTTARLLGTFTLLAGIAGLAYARFNSRADPNNLWVILHGLNDLAFGVIFLFKANNGLLAFVDMLGFWAVIYAFLQSVRAMYAALMEASSSLWAKGIHFLSVAIAGYLAFDIVMRPIDTMDSVAISGFFPIGLGILVIILARLSEREAAVG
jgi:uncharacterized membrane protein HdeD (DUF308 family)